MEFWKWYLGGIIKIPRAIPKAIISPWGEYFTAIVCLSISSGLIVSFLSPFWLLASVPVFVSLCAHGAWRAWAREAKHS